MSSKRKLHWTLIDNVLVADIQTNQSTCLLIKPAGNAKNGVDAFHLYPSKNGFQQDGIGTGSLLDCLQWAEEWVNEKKYLQLPEV